MTIIVNFVKFAKINFKERSAFYLTILLALIFAFFKLNGTSADQTLWAEDGHIFVKQARESGFSSLWIPYSGYLHLYPRLFAWISTFFDLSFTPIIFLSSWFLAYLSLAYVISTRAKDCCKNNWESPFLALLILAQPHSGEVFFNLTNAQWFVGSALVIFVLTENSSKERSWFFKTVIILIASLTGPFVLILMLVLIIQLVLFKDLSKKNFIFIPVLIGVLIQMLFVFSSQRLAQTDDYSIDIERLTRIIVFFGSHSIFLRTLSIIIWAVICKQLVDLLKNYLNKVKNQDHQIHAILLLLASSLFYSATVFVLRDSSNFISPLGDGARYFFIIYSLILFAFWLLLLNQKSLRIGFLIFISTIDCFAYLPISSMNKKDLQFQAHSQFSKVNKEVRIKINPYDEQNHSQWEIYLPNRNLETSADSKIFKIKNDKTVLSKEMLNQLGNEKFFTLDYGSKPRYLFFDISNKCGSSKYLGVEFDIRLNASDRAQIFWSKKEVFEKKQSLGKYFSAGKSKIQFAFPATDVKYLLFYPSSKEKGFELETASLYCL